MAHDLTDVERRLRAARPRAASADPGAFDPDLLARVRHQPIARRRTVPRAVAVPVALGAAVTVTAVVVLAGGPGDVAGPSSAEAITQTLHWLDPPPGTILHVRSVETSATQTRTSELWRSADDPAAQREVIDDGTHRVEISGDALYDPATDTIYEAPATPPDATADRAKGQVSGGTTNATGRAPGKAPGEVPASDPVVQKVRILLSEGRMTVTGRETHNGTDAWAIALNADAGRPVWRLWVSAADGKPLELRDPGRDATEAPQVIRWPTYEVLPASGAHDELTLSGAHPSARVVHDAAQAKSAWDRLGGPKG